jgi:hypothetical protein
LREICNGLGCCLGRLVHAGVTHAPRRPTLSYSNEHRPAALFEELFWTALVRFRGQQALGGKKHEFPLYEQTLVAGFDHDHIVLDDVPAYIAYWLRGVSCICFARPNAVDTSLSL